MKESARGPAEEGSGEGSVGQEQAGPRRLPDRFRSKVAADSQAAAVDALTRLFNKRL